MKKIKEIISTNTITLIVLAILILVILIMGLSFGWHIFLPQDKFTIYKQDCYNLTNEEKCQLIFGKDSVAISREEGFNCYHNLKPGEYNKSWWTPYFDTEEEINLSGELCKKQEVVGEIYEKELINGYKASVEWLEENCECINHCSELVEILGNDTYTECYGKKCFQYKCGEYLVEVKQK